MNALKSLAGLYSMVLILSLGAGSATKASDDFNDKQRKEIEQIIQQYIMNNPKVILEAVDRLRAREEAEKQARAHAALMASREVLHRDPDTPVGGNPDGDVTVVEFFDYRCGYCKRVFPSIMKSIEADKNVRYVFKEFPILGPESVLASKAALAVFRLEADKYQPYHNALMMARGSYTKGKLLKMAADLGMDKSAVEKEMDSPEIEKILRKNHDLAQSLNITGTPAFVIEDQLVPGAIDYSTLEKMIADARKS